jgi:signal transduction histidine kinase
MPKVASPVLLQAMKMRHFLGRKLSWLVHPVSIFVFMQIIWTAILTLWIIWFVDRRREIEKIAALIKPTLLPTNDTSVVVLIVVGIVLLSMLGAGSIMLFTWGLRQTSLIRQQRDFVSSVTHELRTPLASIHLAYETLASRSLPEEMRQKLLTMSLVDIDRLIRLVNQILISSRLDRGLAMFQDDIKDVNVKQSIGEVVKTLSYLDQRISDRIVTDIADNVTWHGSLNAFNMVMSNLLENAIKYSPKRTPVEIKSSIIDNGLLIAVKDYGLGLTPRDKKRIFKMFYRSGDASKRAIPGTGLGLFIVKTTLDQLGGSIAVESEGAALGSKFTATFPI